MATYVLLWFSGKNKKEGFVEFTKKFGGTIITSLGDFNNILRANEKKGRNVQPNWMLNGFKDTMFDCGVSDLPIEGFQFTWERGKNTDRWVEEREQQEGVLKIAVATRRFLETERKTALA